MKVTKPQLKRIIKEEISKVKEDLNKLKVHKYLIDIGFYYPLSHMPTRVDPFSKPAGPDAPAGAGYTRGPNGAFATMKRAVDSGEIDWASWNEIKPILDLIDRQLD